MTSDFKSELHQQLADATALVWKLQNAIAEHRTVTEEVLDYSRRLDCLAGIISDHIARWHLWNLEQGPALVHILRAGFPLCNFVRSLPVHWPAGHTWVGMAEEGVTCPKCRERSTAILDAIRPVIP